MGILQARLGHHAAAEATFRSALSAEPHRIEARKNLGHLYILMGRPHEATAELRHAVRQAPQDAESHFLLATSYRLEGALQAFADELRLVIALDPAGPWGSRAKQLMRQMNLDSEAAQSPALSWLVQPTRHLKADSREPEATDSREGEGRG